MAKFKTNLSITKQIDRVQTKMENLADRSTRGALKTMRHYAEKVMERARWFAPEESGALGDKESWEVDERQNGKNRRITFTVRLKRNATRRVGNRTIKISKYAGHMHDGDYTIRGWTGKKPGEGKEIFSRAKANESPSSRGFPASFPRLVKGKSAANRIGTLYLTRASNHYRLITEEGIRKAMAKELK